VLAIPALILLLAGGIWHWRIALAEWALPRLAAMAGIPLHSLAISRLEPSRVDLADVSLPGFYLRRANLEILWSDPFSPRLHAVVAEGVDGALALDANNRITRPDWLAGLLNPPEGEQPPSTAPSIPDLPIEALSLRNATLDVALPQGAATINLGAVLNRGLEGLPEGRLHLQGTAFDEPLRGELDLTPRHGPAGPLLALGLSGRLGSGSGLTRVDTALTLRVEALEGGGWRPVAAGGPFRIALDASLPPLAKLAGPGHVADGRITIDLRGEADAPISSLLAGSLADLPRLDFTLTTEARDVSLSHPDWGSAEGVDLSGTLEASLSKRWLRIASPFRLSAMVADSPLLALLPPEAGFTAPQRDLVLQARRLDVNLADPAQPSGNGEIWLDTTLANLRLAGDARFDLGASPTLQADNLRLLLVSKGLMGSAGTASLALKALSADEQNLDAGFSADIEMSATVAALSRPVSVIAEMEGQVNRTGDALTLDLGPASTLRLPALDLPGGLTIRPVEGAGLVRIQQDKTGRIGLDITDPVGSLTTDLPLRGLSALLRGADPAGPVRVDTGAMIATATADARALSLKGARITAQGRDLVLNGVDGLLRQMGDEAQASLSVDALTMGGESLLHGPLVLTLSARDLDQPSPRLTAKLTGAAGKLNLSGTASLGATPRIAFKLDPLAFEPGGLQPSALSPRVDALGNMVGGIKAEGNLVLGTKRSGRVDLDLTGIGVDVGPGRLSALTGRISFDMANPPATLPQQKLAALMEVGGLLAGPIDLTYAIRSDGGLDIDSLIIPVLNGRLSTRDVRIAPGAQRIATEIQAERVDLASIFRLIDLEGLTGEGTLSGVLPVRYENGVVAIDEGQLQSDAPGRIAYRGNTLDEQLSASNASVDLLLQALQDFRYDSLSVRVNKATNGLGRLGLSLEGRNPALLDGYPFRLNINLDSDFDRLSGFLLLGFATTEDVLRWVAGQGR